METFQPKRLASPTKLLELLDQFEKNMIANTTLNSLDRFIDNLDAFKGIVSQISREAPILEDDVKVAELLTSFSTDFDKFQEEFTKEFTKLIELTKQTYENWEDKASIRAIVKGVLDRFFTGYRQEGLWLVDIFDEIITDVHLKIETILIELLERQLFGLNVEEIRNFPLALQRFLNELQQFLRLIKEKYDNQDVQDQIKKIGEIYKNLSLSSREMLMEIKNNFEKVRQSRASLLKTIRNELIILDQNIKKDFDKERSRRKIEVQKFKQEITTKEMMIIDLKKQVSVKDKEIEDLQKKLSETLAKTELKKEKPPKEPLEIITTLNELMAEGKRTYMSLKKVAEKLKISTQDLQDLAKKEGFKTTKSRIYKKNKQN
ncbi:MAG: hypothetical protein ACTSRC_17755 [Candidatus Helarchaeota archaeon]